MPLGHAVHAVAAPPAENVLAAQETHEVPPRKLPGEHVNDSASASVNVAPAYTTDPSDVKENVYAAAAGRVCTPGIVEPDQLDEVQPAGVVTHRRSNPLSVRNEKNVSVSARGEPMTDTVSAQLALLEYAEAAVTASVSASPLYTTVELEPHTKEVGGETATATPESAFSTLVIETAHDAHVAAIADVSDADIADAALLVSAPTTT